MRPIPRHWATVHETHSFPGTGAFALTIHGCSDVSVEEARRDARERLDALIAAGGPEQLHASGHEYYPLRRLPEELLEEVRAADGALVAALTRNRYGAAVLNTDALLISDVDLPAEPTRRARAARKRPGLLTRLFGGGADGAGPVGAEPAGAEPAGAEPDAADPDAIGLEGAGERGEAHARILGTIDEFTARHPELGVRTYRTRGGFRLLISGSGAEPSSDRARELMEELRSDRLYVLLCRVHDSYRARLTPKPWRVGMDRFEQLGTRTAEDAVHRDWVRRYDAASQDVAVCRLLEVSGPAPTAVEQQIIELHDRATRPGSGLVLA
ncbi:hypothetical protein ACT3SP_09315 [Brachybacterium sp. AOP43-C2-M15]|uniref:hypothetical protein n=1 Tax=Brachybacterium sp. AOP43-C2-M15 TaxID=3457661 RepID=UPI004033DEDA